MFKYYFKRWLSPLWIFFCQTDILSTLVQICLNVMCDIYTIRPLEKYNSGLARVSCEHKKTWKLKHKVFFQRIPLYLLLRYNCISKFRKAVKIFADLNCKKTTLFKAVSVSRFSYEYLPRWNGLSYKHLTNCHAGS